MSNKNTKLKLVPEEIGVVIKTQANIIEDQLLRIDRLKELVTKQGTEIRKLRKQVDETIPHKGLTV